MNKGDLIKILAQKTNLSQRQAEDAINTILDTFKEYLAKGEDITLVGFGSFKVVQKPPRKGRNPQTGQEIEIPARKAIKFTPGKNLKEQINQ